MLRALTNGFWFVFAADGLVSAADEAMKISQAGSLGLLRDILAIAAIVWSLVLAVTLVVTTRVPRRAMLPMIFTTWWTAGLGFPLNILRVPNLGLWLSIGQVAVALAVYLLFRAKRGERGFPFALKTGPAFAWPHSIFTGAGMVAAAFVLGTMFLLSLAATGIESVTGGYVRLRPDGIYLIERQFRHGDREVRLTGMMHIARPEFYLDVLPKADPRTPAVVLVEGVTDRKDLLGEDTLRYTKIAEIFNVTSQEDSLFTRQVAGGLRKGRGEPEEALGEWSNEEGLDFRHADVDVATFHPKTIAFIVTVMGAAHSGNLGRLVDEVTNPASPLNDDGAQEQVMKDILDARNERLTAEIDDSLKSYRRVIVPWGALHLKGVEAWLREREFEQSGEVERKAMSFW